MFGQYEKLQQLNDLLMNHGRDLILGLVVIIAGFLGVRWCVQKLRDVLQRLFPDRKWIATFVNVVGILLILVVVVAASVEAGLPIRPVVRVLIIISMAAVGTILIFRPLVPDLPFKVGNTIKVGSLLGKVEGITFLNTRLLTFDGKTVFVPNRKILDDIVINYHFTQNRRIKVNLGIDYESDLIRAKQIFEELMIADPRVLVTPRPVVYVLALTKERVELGARCWVPNMKFWLTKADLIERIKLTFDREGIRIAHSQMDLYFREGRGELPTELEEAQAEESA